MSSPPSADPPDAQPGEQPDPEPTFLDWALERIADSARGDRSAPVFGGTLAEAASLSEAERALVHGYPADAADPAALRRDLAALLDRHMANGRTPRFQNQLFSGVSDPGMAGTLLGIHPNNTLSTREAAPLPSAVEGAVCDWMLRQVPWDGEQAAGTATPGGSFSNYLAVYLARRRATDRLGHGAITRLAVFTSAASHYSIPKGSDLAGFDPANVFEVETDGVGRMIPDRLAAALAAAESNGLEPALVNATLGTTVMGTLDPVADIAGVIGDRPLWLHVDGAWGALGLLSSRRDLFAAGLERADSLTWDAHKGGGAPVAASYLLVRDASALQALHPLHRGGYLFHAPDAAVDEADLGLTSLYCGKPFLSLALWLVWKSRGVTGMRAAVDRAWELTTRFRDRMEGSNLFDLAAEPESWVVCVRPRPRAGDDPVALVRATRARVNAAGRWMMNVCPAPGEGDAPVLRALFVNPLMTAAHADELADHLEASHPAAGA